METELIQKCITKEIYTTHTQFNYQSYGYYFFPQVHNLIRIINF